MFMKSRVAIVAAGLAIPTVLSPLGACVPEDPGSVNAGSGGGNGGGGNAGNGTGASGTGGAGGMGPANCNAGGVTGSVSPLANYETMRTIVGTCSGSGCHNEGQSPRVVDDATLYATLTTYVVTTCGNRVLVKPCHPDDSAFYLAQRGMCGALLPQMPLGCVDDCTPENYLEGIREWIAKGALKQ